ncbi:hypothetical protein MZO26_00260 (plasmid) [Enterococcus faecalis]|uniref:Uncharacterized protein n=4 Tax=Enterococcus TaxID=1350 RepID=A0AAX3AVK9_ENTFL|nr:hypothetical protein [Enterococcus faecalis]MCT9928085.1 hypothetical protein [Enterococcus faecalis]MCV5984453.1 hypothetical protein [Enterococcus faecalis]MCV5994593.1 hypothetical protein [Enterococcus faecalis]MCV6008874.1 hypothetical protein [Enterococcus faecalis]UPQ25498.1 hypothetical protein MZO29_00220 [Enterococcus faecalis]
MNRFAEKLMNIQKIKIVNDNTKKGENMKIIDSLSLDALIAVSAAMLTLLIPVAIFLIEGTNNDNEDSFAWNRMVIFSQIIKPKSTYFSMILITVPLIFWNSSNTPCKIIILLLIVLGNVIMFSILKSSYFWIISKNQKNENFRERVRLKFLNELSENKEMSIKSKVETWQTIWKSEKVDMDSCKIIEAFENFYTSVKDDVKYQLLHVFSENLKIDFENKDKVQEFVYFQINQYNHVENKMKSAIKDLFLNYMRISAQETYLRYSFFVTFDKFFSEADDKIVERIFQDIGVELIEIIKELHLNRVEDDFPEFLKYDTVKSEIKKNSLCNMYFKWLDERYVLIHESNFEERMFANKLLMFMFEKVSPISFFRLTEFSSELCKNYYSEESLKNTIVEFARKPVKFIGIGRVYSIISSGGEANDKNKFDEMFKQDVEWTYQFISNSNQEIYKPLKDKNIVQETINLIEELVSENQNILNEKEKSKLQGVKVELKHYKEQIFG